VGTVPSRGHNTQSMVTRRPRVHLAGRACACVTSSGRGRAVEGTRLGGHLEQNGADVLGANGARLEHRKARLHEDDQCSGEEYPQGVDPVHYLRSVPSAV
jgi:hypothetical protein